VTRIDLLKNIQAEPPQQAATDRTLRNTDLGRDADIFSELLPINQNHEPPFDQSPPYQGPPIFRLTPHQDPRYLGPPIASDPLPPRSFKDFGPPPRDPNEDPWLNEDQLRPLREPRRYPVDRIDNNPENSNLRPWPIREPRPCPVDEIDNDSEISILPPLQRADATIIPGAPDGVMTVIGDAGKKDETQTVDGSAPAPRNGSPLLDLTQPIAAVLQAQFEPSVTNALADNFVTVPIAGSTAVPDPALISIVDGIAAAPAQLPAQATAASGQDSTAIPVPFSGTPVQASMAPDAMPLFPPAQIAKSESPEAATQPAAQGFVVAAPADDNEAVALIKQFQPEKTDVTVEGGEAASMPDAQSSEQTPAQAQDKLSLPEQSDDIAKTKAFADKNNDPGTKTNNGLHLGAQIVKGEISAANTPHQYGHQIVRPELPVSAPPALDGQTAITRVGVALARVPFEIAVSAHKGEKEFEIRLDPPELGRVDVSLSVDKNGRIATHLMVERPATLDQLRKDAPNLERALQNSGLKTDSGSLQFSLRDQNAQNFAGNQSRDGTIRRGILTVALNETTALARPYMASLGSGRGTGIDLRV
jgi:flagellar hook-length control protein FliK